jgi:hypothetical protein
MRVVGSILKWLFVNAPWWVGWVFLRLGVCCASLRHAVWVSLPKSVGSEAQRWGASSSIAVASGATCCVIASSAKRSRIQHRVLVASSSSVRVVPRAFGFQGSIFGTVFWSENADGPLVNLQLEHSVSWCCSWRLVTRCLSFASIPAPARSAFNHGLPDAIQDSRIGSRSGYEGLCR